MFDHVTKCRYIFLNYFPLLFMNNKRKEFKNIYGKTIYILIYILSPQL